MLSRLSRHVRAGMSLRPVGERASTARYRADA